VEGEDFGRIRREAPDRAFRGSAVAPAPALRTVAAPRPSNPLREKECLAPFLWINFYRKKECLAPF
jgi:hypothetical protein